MEPTNLDILDKLHTFYSVSFSQLVTYTIALLALVGGLIPIVISYLQNRSFRRETQTITKELSQHADSIRGELKSDSKKISDEIKTSLKTELNSDITAVEKRLTDLITRTEANLNKKLAGADAGVFHVQGIANIQGRSYARAAASYASAAQHYLIAEDELNLRRVIKGIEGLLREDLNKADLQADPEIEPLIESLVKSLNANDVNGRYTDNIRQIKKTLADAKERVPASKAATSGN